MDIYIVDTNLLYSSFLNIDSRISQFILSCEDYNVNLFAPTYLESEIERHKSKIIEYTGYSEVEFSVIKKEIFQRIKFIDDGLIPFEEWVKALRLVRDIDKDDVNFVALNNFVDKELWTGDVELYKGLKAKGYNKVVNFQDLKNRYGL